MRYGRHVCLSCFHSWSGPFTNGLCEDCRGEAVLSPWDEDLHPAVVHCAILAIAGVSYSCEPVRGSIIIHHHDPIVQEAT